MYEADVDRDHIHDKLQLLMKHMHNASVVNQHMAIKPNSEIVYRLQKEYGQIRLIFLALNTLWPTFGDFHCGLYVLKVVFSLLKMFICFQSFRINKI